MNRTDLKGQKVVIWGTGMEAQAAAQYIRDAVPTIALIFVDENMDASLPDMNANDRLITQLDQIEKEVLASDIVIKSPGVSLYHPLLEKAKAAGIRISSLLNLWIAENDASRVIMVTGTKGKSTTASLLSHVLQQLGKRVTLLGNFGVPVTQCRAEDFDYVILEVSSYQAANFEGQLNFGVMTSLYPEHLDWHRDLATYYTDKCRILEHCKTVVLSQQARLMMEEQGIALSAPDIYEQESHFHFEAQNLCDDGACIGELKNPYLLRPHNQQNVCAVMSIIKLLRLSLAEALASMAYYKGLPHRQQEIGEIDNILYVDDSISTTPQSAIAALNVYADRQVTLIVGGFDRGVDYMPLASHILASSKIAVIAMGQTGPRVIELLNGSLATKAVTVSNMQEAVMRAKEMTPKGGVILLSPAAPSYDMYENYMARAASFAREARLVSHS